MAGHELIDDYLGALRRRLAWRPDVDDVLAEVGDHLFSAVERLVTEGTDPEAAERLVLERFGDSTTVATAFAATGNGGLAVPTRFTQLAGMVAHVAAALWVAMAACWLIDQVLDPTGVVETAIGVLAFATLMGAASATVVVVVGLNKRHGGLGPLGTIGVGLVALGVVSTLLFWFVMGWGVLLAVGMGLVALAMHGRRLAPTAATIAFGGAWLVGITTWSVLRYLEVGTRDEWGDYPIVSPIAIVVGVVILAPGLVGLGHWLRAETPADFDRAQPLATA